MRHYYAFGYGYFSVMIMSYGGGVRLVIVFSVNYWNTGSDKRLIPVETSCCTSELFNDFRCVLMYFKRCVV